jgi:1-deoxy-D-xylulose-5-phosphate reductoisomerase
MTVRQQVCVLGATGSIGLNTLDVIKQHPQRYQVYALSAHRDVAKLFELCCVHAPRFAVMVDAAAAQELAQRLASVASTVQVLSGPEALVQIASDPAVQIVMAAIVGAAGLPSALAAVQGGKKVLLANKEALVMAGQLFMDAVQQHGATLLPIDSEHNAIFQCLPDAYRCGASSGPAVRRILLTASGGPFRLHSHEQLHGVTAQEACRHPNWSMGQKISVDSATLMNKGLELIEACWLFNTTPAQIDVVVHPESIIHSMVEYVDGSTLAQLGNPDMRTPIAYGLAWPQRIASGASFLDLVQQKQLNFEAPDESRFPCLALARRAFELGGTACVVLNAANEVAVAEFLAGTLPFMAIPAIIARVLEHELPTAADSLAQILAADQRARDYARVLLADYSRDSLKESCH